MHSHIRFVLATPLILLTAGCANISGAPRSVIPAGQLQQLIESSYSVDTTLTQFYSNERNARGGQSRQDYRDRVAGMYMAAADANYQSFRSALGSSSRGSSVGFDTVSLLLTGLAASSSGNRAQDLATAATALTGFRTSFDRNLLFDRTIPAIIASMDAERARARASIVERLRADATAYPLPQFFADLQTYELSATLERAISRVNETANEDRAAAQERLGRALRACDIMDDGDAAMASLADQFELQEAGRDNMEIAARVLDVPYTAETADDDLYEQIGIRLETGFCSRGARAEIVRTIDARIAETRNSGDE